MAPGFTSNTGGIQTPSSGGPLGSGETMLYLLEPFYSENSNLNHFKGVRRSFLEESTPRMLANSGLPPTCSTLRT